MKEDKLLSLGFVKNSVTMEESGSNAFYYFTFDIGDTCVLISQSDDEVRDGDYAVELFEYPDAGKVYDNDKIERLVEAYKFFCS